MNRNIELAFLFVQMMDLLIRYHKLECARKNRRRLEVVLTMVLRYRQMLLLLSGVEGMSTKSCWTMIRHQLFWEVDCQVNSDGFFKENFRMSRKSFQKLVGLMKDLEKSDTNMRQAIPFDKRVAVSVYALGSAAEYRSVANLFGIGKSTVCVLVKEFCMEVWRCLRPIYLQNFPLTEERIQEYVNGFNAMGYPQCLGAIDGCHIEIRPHSEDAVDYFNYKGWYSTVLLALVDARYRFIYTSVGTPGRCNDSQIFENSALKRLLENCQLLADMSKDICGVNVPVHIIGDSAFKLTKMVMKPYPFSTTQSDVEKNYNYNISKCRRVVENAFGQLKGRFRRIGKGVDNHIDNCAIVINACVVLHNFLNEESDSINQNWLQAQVASEMARPSPQFHTSMGNGMREPEAIRKALSMLFSRDVDGAVDDDVGAGDAGGDAGGAAGDAGGAAGDAGGAAGDAGAGVSFQ